MMRLALIASLLVISIGSVIGQAHIDARGLGLCNAYTVTSRGIASLGINPANLGFTDEVKFSADIFDFQIGAFNNYMSLALFNRFFTGDINGDGLNLEEMMPDRDMTRKEYLLSQLPDDGYTIGLGVSLPIPLLNISWGNYAFSTGLEYFQRFTLPSGILEMALEGNPVGKAYDMAVSQDIIVVSNMGFSFAIPFESYNVGATVKYLAGLGFASVDSSGGTFTTLPTGLESDAFYRLTSAIGGNGLAVDVGLTSQKMGNWQYAVAINNIIGFINWGNDDNIIGRNINFIEGVMPLRSWLQIPDDGNALSSSTVRTLEMENVGVTGALANSDSLFEIKDQTVAVPDSIRMNYPAIFRLGASYQYENDFIVVADLSAGLDDYYFADRTWRIALAAEWLRFKMVPLRSGFAFGGPYGREASLGIGAHLLWFDADFALKFLGGMSLTSAEGIEFGINFRFKR